jgi:hypothetical protein
MRSLLTNSIVPEQFVSLEISDGDGSGDGRDYIPIIDILKSNMGDRILIVGGPGAGKSTLAQFIAHSAWTSPAKVGLMRGAAAIFISLPTLVSNIGSVNARLAMTLSQEHGTPWTSTIVEEFLKNTKFARIAVLDALDEVPSGNDRVLTELLSAMERCGVRVVMSCRTASLFRFSGMIARFRKLTIMPLTQHDVERFAHAHLPHDDANSFSVAWRELSGSHSLITPLAISMAMTIFSQRHTVPAGRAALYRDHFVVLLSEAWERIPERRVLSEEYIVGVLSAIALRAAEEFGAIRRVEVVDLLSRMRPVMDHGVAPESILAFLVEEVGILVVRVSRIEFAHPSFHEYFLASSFGRRTIRGTGRVAKLAAKWRDRRFSESIIFGIEVASTQGRETDALLEEIVRATDLERVCARVAIKRYDELVFIDPAIGLSDEEEEYVITAQEEMAQASEALWYVVRCLNADSHSHSSVREMVADMVVRIILSWFAADYREDTYVRYDEIAQHETAVSILTKMAAFDGLALTRLRIARAADTDYNLIHRICISVAVVDCTHDESEAESLLEVMREPVGIDELTDAEEFVVREYAIFTLLETPVLVRFGIYSVVGLLPYWCRNYGDGGMDYSLLQNVLSRQEIPDEHVLSILSRHLYMFCCASYLSESERERRIRIALRGTSRWASELVLSILEARTEDGASVGFPEVEIVVEVSSDEGLRSRIHRMARRWDEMDLLDSYAAPYLHSRLQWIE